jgi:ssDNA-binding Zn-finger/Zn-ribbon topoisomerase 1
MKNCHDCRIIITHSPCARYCPDCQAIHDIRLELECNSPRARKIRRNEAKRYGAFENRPGDFDLFSGSPNVTCPACNGRYHYGAPVPFTHLCPLCGAWLCWEETDKLKEVKRRVARKCPRCNKILQERNGPYGPWWGCTYIKKGHKDNCAGKRKWGDCDIVVETVPRLGLAVWRAHVWDDSDEVDHFAGLDRETQERKTAIEARRKAYEHGRWWLGEGVDGLDS